MMEIGLAGILSKDADALPQHYDFLSLFCCLCCLMESHLCSLKYRHSNKRRDSMAFLLSRSHD